MYIVSFNNRGITIILDLHLNININKNREREKEREKESQEKRLLTAVVRNLNIDQGFDRHSYMYINIFHLSHLNIVTVNQ